MKHHAPPPQSLLPPIPPAARPLAVLLALGLALLLAAAGPSPAAAAKVVADQRAAFAPRLNADGELELGVLRSDYAGEGEAWSPAAETVIATRAGSRTTVPAWTPDHPEFAAAWGAPGGDLWTTGGEANRGELCEPYRDAEERNTVDLSDSIAELLPELAQVNRTRNTTTILHAITPPAGGRATRISVLPACTDEEPPWVATMDADSGDPDTLPDRWRTEGDPDSSGRENPKQLAFTRAGYACLDLEIRATLTSGRRVRDRAGFAVAVGDADPQAAPDCPVGDDGTATETTVSASDGGGIRSLEQGTEVTFTANVDGSGTPEGTVRFFDDDGRGGDEQPLGEPVPVAGDGTARLTTDDLGPGVHAIRASFTPEDEEQQAPSSGTLTPFRVHAPGHFVLPPVHADVGLRSADDGALDLGLQVSADSYQAWYGLDDSIVYVPDVGKEQVPAPAGGQDYGLLGPVGSDVWQIPLASRTSEGIPWLGVSSEAITDRLYRRYTALRLEGAAGIDGGPAPGEFVLWTAADGSKPFLSTRQGVPDAVRMLARASGHWHATWSFTKPGIYCLNLSARNRKAADGAPVQDDGVLTVVVGDAIDPYGSETCAERDVRPKGTPAAEPDVAPAGQRHVLDMQGGARSRAFAALTPRLRDGRLEVPLVEGSDRGPGTAHDVDDAILRMTKEPNGVIGTADAGAGSRVPWAGENGQRIWEVDEAGEQGRYRLGWDTTRLADDDLQGDLTWRLTGVEGPGEFVLHDEWGHRAGKALLSTRAGYAADRFDLWPGHRVDGTWFVTEPGTYCVGVTWSGTRRDGTPLEVRKTLTIVAGDVDVERVTPCGRGGHGDRPPVDGPPTQQPPPSGGGDQGRPAPGPAGRAKPVITSLRLLRSRTRLATLRRDGRIRLRCRISLPGRCEVRAAVSPKVARALRLRVPKRAASVTLVRRSVSYAKAGTREFTIRLPAKVRRALGRSRTTRSIRIAATGRAGGRPSTTSVRHLRARR